MKESGYDDCKIQNSTSIPSTNDRIHYVTPLRQNKNQQRDPTSRVISHPLLIPQPLPPSQVVNPLWINIGKNNAKKLLISRLLDGGMI